MSYGNFRSMGSTPSSGQLGMGNFNPMEEFEFYSQPQQAPSWMPATKVAEMNSLPTINDMSGGGGGFLPGINGFLKDNGPLLGLLQSGLGAFMGMKQYGLAKDQFNFQKDAWNKEYEINKNLTNERLETRQKRRIAESGVTGLNQQDTASYMARYGVK